MQGDVRLFEIGAVFSPMQGALPHEELHVGAVIMGRRRPAHFSDPKTAEFEHLMTFDAWDAKALAELIASEAFEGAQISLEDGADSDLWRITANGATVGLVRQLALDAQAWAKPAFGVEVSLGIADATNVAPPGEHAYRVAEYPSVSVHPYRPLPSQPASPIDITLLIPDSVRAADVDRAIREASGDLLESLVLVDEYSGKNIEPGHRSLAWRLTFRHPERTLSAKEIEGRRTNVLRHLEKTLHVRQRTT